MNFGKKEKKEEKNRKNLQNYEKQLWDFDLLLFVGKPFSRPY